MSRPVSRPDATAGRRARPDLRARDLPRVLSIAGSDPSGGAGVQADLKSIAAHGGYGMAALSALTAQNTHGVRAVHVPPPSFLRAQLDAVSDDIVVDAVKVGMLARADVVGEVAAWLDRVAPPLVVLDPVMVSTSGHRLLDADAEAAVRDLCARADLLTPNLAELAVLVDRPAAPDWSGALAQAAELSARTGAVVLAKGGHLARSACDRGGEAGCPDALVDAAATPVVPGGLLELPGRRLASTGTHGTGCSLSAAMATLLARTADWAGSARTAKTWLRGAIEHGPELEVGTGHGPVHHLHAWWAAAP